MSLFLKKAHPPIFWLFCANLRDRIRGRIIISLPISIAKATIKN